MALRTIYIHVKGKIIEKVIGAVLTENNFTDAEKQKLTSLPGITVGTTPPPDPQEGDLWIDTNN